MKNEPQVIWLQLGEDADLMADEEFFDLVRGDGDSWPSWCWHKIDDGDIAYVHLDTVLALVEDVINRNEPAWPVTGHVRYWGDLIRLRQAIKELAETAPKT